MSSVRSKSKFVSRDYGIQTYRSSKSFAQQMRKTTEKALDDVSVRAQSELVRPYLAPRYEEHEYEAIAPSGETSIDLTVPDIAWATIPIIAAQFKVATPLFSVSSGTYSSAQTVQILCATSGATIYYTLNNTEPNENSTKYTGALTISATTTLKAKAFKSEWTESATAEGAYIIQQWAAYFDNTFWEPARGPLAVWDGTKWDSVLSGGINTIGLNVIGTWNIDFRPTKMRIGVNLHYPVRVRLLDETEGYPNYSTWPDYTYMSGDEVSLTFNVPPNNNLHTLIVEYVDTAFSITNIEFLA